MELEVLRTVYKGTIVEFETATATNQTYLELARIYRKLKELQYRILQVEIGQAKKGYLDVA